MMKAEQQKDLRNYLLTLVAKKEYTTKQLKDKAFKRYPELDLEVFEELVHELEEKGFVKDARFAELYIRQAIAKGDGPLKIQQKLYEKGIATTISSELLEDQYPFEAQLEVAKVVVQKKSGQPTDKQARFLASRGFESGVVWKAIK